MSQASNYTEDRTLDFWLKANSQSTTAPTTVYIGLATSDPSTGSTDENLEAGTLTDEVSTVGTAYARQAATFGTISNGSVSTSADITFPTATASFGEVTHIFISDSATAGAGEILFYGSMSASKQIDSGDSLQFTSGNITVTLA
jgi:hypothetical protein